MSRQAAGRGRSLWEGLAPETDLRPALAGEVRTDVAVVGGGILGLSAALALVEAGRRVVVLDEDRVGSGASGRNAGFVVPNFARVDPDAVVARLGHEAGERLLAATGASGDLVFDLVRRHAIACDARQDGWIQPAHAPVAVPRLRRRMEAWQRRGRPVEWLDRDRLSALVGVDRWPGGWIDRSGGRLDPLAYTRGLATAAERAGAAIFEETRVRSIERRGDAIVLRAPGGAVAADRVLVATNASGSPDARLAAAFLPLTVHQIATEPLPPEVRSRVLPGGQTLGDSARNLFTARFDAAGRLISGGMAILPAGADARVAGAILKRLRDVLGLPATTRIEYAWTGRAAIMPDFLPHIVDLGPGILAGFGCNGRGIAVSTMLGRALADAALGVPSDELPVAPGPPVPVRWPGLARFATHLFLPYAIARDAFERRRAV